MEQCELWPLAIRHSRLNLCYQITFLQTLWQRFQNSFPQAVAESEQPCEDPTTGIETAPSHKEKPRTLQTHDQHTANYVGLMMEEGMDLPMGEDRVAPLITEV